MPITLIYLYEHYEFSMALESQEAIFKDPREMNILYVYVDNISILVDEDIDDVNQ